MRVIPINLSQVSSEDCRIADGATVATPVGTIPYAAWVQSTQNGAQSEYSFTTTKGCTFADNSTTGEAYDLGSTVTVKEHMTNMGNHGQITSAQNMNQVLKSWLGFKGPGTAQDSTLKVEDIPFDSYDAIVIFSGYCSSYAAPNVYDVSSLTEFPAVYVTSGNITAETGYTYSNGETTTGTTAWGSRGQDAIAVGTNALRIDGLMGNLTLKLSQNNAEGIAGVILVERALADCALTLNGTAVNWSEAGWTSGGVSVSAPTAGNATITLTASTTLTIDSSVALNKLVVNGSEDAVLTLALGGGGSFVAGNSVEVNGGVLQQGSASVLGATPILKIADGATLDLNGQSMNAATVVYMEGAGAGSWPWVLTSSGAEFTGTIQTMYLTGDATIGGANKLTLGADWSGSNCYLQNHTITKTGLGELRVRNLNTPDTGAIIVSQGELHTDQWNCLDKSGGTLTLTIGANGSVRGTNQPSNPPAATTLNWEGTLNTASRNFIVKSSLVGGGETAYLNFNAGASASLKRNLDVTSELVLSGNATFLKNAAAENDVTVTAATLTAASGTITVGAGVTFNLGTNRPGASFDVDDDATLAVRLASSGDTPIIHVAGKPANVMLYDENGDAVPGPTVIYDSEAGTITLSAENIWTAAADSSFDTVGNWSAGATPSAGANATVLVTGDTAVTVADNYTLGTLYISGSGIVSFIGEGSISASIVVLQNGATLARNSSSVLSTTAISASSGCSVSINAGEGSYAESAVISGDGAVLTYGNVDMAALNTFTGGITAKTGTLTTSAGSTSVSPWRTGFGTYQTGWANANQLSITVEDGACVDLNNVINNGIAYKLTIAGKGVETAGVYSGAVKYTGATAQGSTSRQLSNIALTGDALVDLGAGWGLVHHDYGAATLSLNAHTLTIRGTDKQNFPMQNTTASSGGTIVLENSTLLVGVNKYGRSCSLPGVTIVAKGGSKLDLDMDISAIGSVVIAPSAAASVAIDGYAHMANVVPVVKTSYIDASALASGDVITLMTTDTTLTKGENVAIVAGSRYAVEAIGQNVTATVCSGIPANFMHYDFNAANSIASDSTYNCGNLNPTFVSGKNGQAGRFVSGTTPWYDSNTANKSPFHAGEMSVTALLKIKEASNTIIWNIGSTAFDGRTGIALIAKNQTTLTLVSWVDNAAGSDVVSVTGVDVLDNKWHLVTIVANANGTTLFVDGLSSSVEKCLPSDINARGQFGSIHGSAKEYSAVSTKGFLLDDWRVYDAALTAKEVKALKSALLPDPLFIRLR